MARITISETTRQILSVVAADDGYRLLTSDTIKLPDGRYEITIEDDIAEMLGDDPDAFIQQTANQNWQKK
jgi:hypothetical protein